MSYCTKEDLIADIGEAEIIQRTGGNGTGVINDTVLTKAITDASGIIDRELPNYSRPISPITPALIKICCDITRYLLYKDVKAPDYVALPYQNAMDYLRRVSKGQADFGVDMAGTQPTEQVAATLLSSDKRLFARS